MRALARRLGVGVGMVLEGGYNVPVLSECVLATLPALLSDEQPRPHGQLEAGERQLIDGALAQVRRHWAV